MPMQIAAIRTNFVTRLLQLVLLVLLADFASLRSGFT